MHLLSATASDFRSVGKTASSYDAPHGGDIADDTMRAMEDLIVRLLRARNAIDPDGERVTAAEVKVMMARASRCQGDDGAKATLDASRTGGSTPSSARPWGLSSPSVPWSEPERSR